MKKILELFNRLPLSILVLFCITAFLTPAVQAATAVQLSQTATYAIAVLGIVTLGLCIYLFVVIFQPERF